MMSRNEPARILIVDEDPAILRALTRFFRVEGFSIQTADDLATFKKGLESFMPHAVVTEFLVRGKEVTNLLEGIRRLSPYTSVVMLTGISDIETAQDVLSRGLVDRLFTKPWDDHALLQGVLSSMRERQLLKELEETNQRLEELVAIRTRQLEKAKRELEATIDAFEEPLFIVDGQNFEVRRANLAFAGLVGRDVKEVPARRCHALLCGRAEPCEHCPMKDKVKQRHCRINGLECSAVFFEVKGKGLDESFVVHLKCR